MNRIAVAWLIAIGLLLVPAKASARWTRLSSEHFVFVGDVSDRELRDIARRLEQFREVVGRIFSQEATSTPVPTVVLVFQNDRSFTPFKPVYRGKPVAVAGFFVGTEDVNYIAVSAARDSAAFGVIYHEYAHFLIRNAVGDAPAWVNEGLAQFYETFESRNRGKGAMLGMPRAESLRVLQASSALLPISQLIAVKPDSAMYNEGDRRNLFYAESWALVHYLTFGAPARTGQLKTYLAAVLEGVPGAEAFGQAFGSDTAGLERELATYIRALALSALQIDFDERIMAREVSSGEEISDVEAAGYLGDMMARTNRIDDARQYLRKTIDANTNAARAIAALGLLELRATNDDAALPLLERAASLAPGVATIQSAYGRALTRRADRGWADEDALYARARTVLGRALELDPDNVSTMVTLAEVEMGSGADPARAVRLVQRALAASPGREEYRLMLAQALAMNGDYRGASNVLGPLMERGSRVQIRDAAREALARVAEAQNAVRALR